VFRPSAIVRQEALSAVQVARLGVHRKCELAHTRPAVPRARSTLIGIHAQLAALRPIRRSGIIHRTPNRHRIRIHQPIRTLIPPASGRDERIRRAAGVECCARSLCSAGIARARGCDGVGGAAVGGAGHGLLGESGVVGESRGAGGLEEGVGLAVGGCEGRGDGAGAGIEAEGAFVGCGSGCSCVEGWGGGGGSARVC